jgi:hypothetical protein
MNRIAMMAIISLLPNLGAGSQLQADDTWDLARVFNSSTAVFYGEVLRTVPEPLFRTGVSGVHVQDIRPAELPLQELIWEQGTHFTLTVIEGFKGISAEQFECYRSDQAPDLWTYLENAAGDVFLSPPVALDPLLLNLSQTNRGLFFIRDYLGSTIPVLYRVRMGQRAEDDRALLRIHQSAGDMPLEQILQQYRRQLAIEAEQAAAAFKVFEDEYYQIIRTRELAIRRSLLEDLVVRMGYDGRWSYYAFKERYIAQHGAYLAAEESPSVPSDQTEMLWKMASEELAKIDVILQARAK